MEKNYLTLNELKSKLSVLEKLQQEFPNNEELRIKIITIKELIEDMNRKEELKFVTITNGINVYKIECDFVASNKTLQETIDWYRREIGYDADEPLDVSNVDKEKEGLWVELDKRDNDYETLSYLYYLADFKELIMNNMNDKIGNIRIINGDLCRFISFKQYCDDNLREKKEVLEIIASTEF